LICFVSSCTNTISKKFRRDEFNDFRKRLEDLL
jgi:hypothetical protein